MEVSFWIVPEAEVRARYQARIDRLAREHDAQPFVPHVTVYSGLSAQAAALRLLAKGAAATRALTLRPVGTAVSERFTKTFVIEFEPSQEPGRLHELLRRESSEPSDYKLAPHLSLLYKQMPLADLEVLRQREPVRLEPIVFGELWAVHTPSPVETPEDVARWHVLGRRALGGA